MEVALALRVVSLTEVIEQRAAARSSGTAATRSNMRLECC
jgi:hypothetical protein